MNFSNNLKSFLKDSTIYTLLNLLNKAIPFLLLPIIVRILSTEDFGKYSLFLNLEAMLIPLVTLNLPAALSRHFYDKEIILSKYLSTLLISLILLCLLFFLTGFIIPDFIIGLTGLTKDLFQIAIISASVGGILAMFSNLFRLQRKPWLYGLISISQSVLLFVFIFVFISITPTFEMIIYSKISYLILFLLIVLILLSKYDYLEKVCNQEYFNKALKFALPTVIYSISAFIFSSSDRFFINYYLGTEEVGYYSAIFQLTSLISVIGMSINAAWIPWLFENLSKKDDSLNIFIVKLSYGLICAFIFIGVSFIFLFPVIAKIVLPLSFHQYIYLSIPIIIGFVFEGIYLIVSPYLFYAEQTKYNGFIGIFIAIINVILNIILIPKLGLLGSAITTATTWALLALIFFIFSNRVYPMPWLYFMSKSTLK